MDVWLAELLALLGLFAPVLAYYLPLPAYPAVAVLGFLGYVSASWLSGLEETGWDVVWLGLAWIDFALWILSFVVVIARLLDWYRRRRYTLRGPPELL